MREMTKQASTGRMVALARNQLNTYVQIHLGYVLGADDLDAGEALHDTLPEDGHDDVHQALLNLHRVVQILEGGHVDLVGVAGAAGEEHDPHKCRHIQQENRIEHHLPELQKGVGVGVLAEAVLQVQAQPAADPPVNKGQQHDEDRHEGSHGQDGDGAVHWNGHTNSIRAESPFDNNLRA